MKKKEMEKEKNSPEEIKGQYDDKIKDYKITHRPKSDSVRIWFDAIKDDIGQKVTEKLEFSYATAQKQDTVSLFYKYNAKNAMEINSDNGGGSLAPKAGFKISSNYYLNKINSDKSFCFVL